MGKPYGYWIKQYSATVGSGEITLTTAVDGFATLSSQIPTGESFGYALENGDNREYGIGTLTTPTALQRDTVLATLVGGIFNDNSPTAIDLSGVTEVAVSLEASLVEWLDALRESAPSNAGFVPVVDSGGILQLQNLTDAGTY